MDNLVATNFSKFLGFDKTSGSKDGIRSQVILRH